VLTRLVFPALVLLLVQPAAADSEADSADGPIIFNEIYLGEEGVWGIDSSGHEFHYDFDVDAFVPGYPDEGGRSREGDGRRRHELEAIEDRATEPVYVEAWTRRSVSIGENEYVDGDIVAWGRVTVKGWVKGDVKSYQGRVLVTATGQVDGDIEAPEVIVREGGEVLGEISEDTPAPELPDFSSDSSSVGILVAFIFSFVVVLTAFILVTVFRRQTERVNLCLRSYGARSFVLGFLLVLGLPMLVAAVTITVVGVILLPLVPLAYLLASVLGYIAYGRRLGARILGPDASTWLTTSLGALLLMLPWLFTAMLLSTASEVIQGFGVFSLVMSILLTVFLACSGVGGALLTRFGFREYVPRSEAATTDQGAPAPPPIPEPPAVPDAPNPPGDSADETSSDQNRTSEQN